MHLKDFSRTETEAVPYLQECGIIYKYVSIPVPIKHISNASIR